MKKKTLIILTVAIVLFLAFSIWMVWSNLSIKITEYSVSSDSIPKAFDGYRIAQISDLHNAEFGKENEKLLDKLALIEPDIIAITGDMIDSSKTNVDIALAFAEKAVEIAPVYYVTGNHESRVIQEYQELNQLIHQLLLPF